MQILTSQICIGMFLCILNEQQDMQRALIKTHKGYVANSERGLIDNSESSK